MQFICFASFKGLASSTLCMSIMFNACPIMNILLDSFSLLILIVLLDHRFPSMHDFYWFNATIDIKRIVNLAIEVLFYWTRFQVVTWQFLGFQAVYSSRMLYRVPKQTTSGCLLMCFGRCFLFFVLILSCSFSNLSTNRYNPGERLLLKTPAVSWKLASNKKFLSVLMWYKGQNTFFFYFCFFVNVFVLKTGFPLVPTFQSRLTKYKTEKGKKTKNRAMGINLNIPY